MDFKDRIAVVTGASRGIGAAIARAFAAEGATVVVNYLQNEAAAGQVVAACQAAGGDAVAMRADVTSEAAIHDMVEEVLGSFGKIDILVNNAFKPYTFDPEARPLFWNSKWRDYERQFDGALLIPKASRPDSRGISPDLLL